MDSQPRPPITYNFWLIVLFFLSLLPGLANADQQWQLAEEKDGIRVYLRPVEGSEIREFKGVVKISSSLDSLAGVLHNNQACPLWVHQCKDPAVLETFGFSERYVYQVNDFPFPAANRDIIMHALILQQPNDKTLTVKLTAAPDYCNDSNSEQCQKIIASDNVHIQKSQGFYRLQPQNDGTVEVTWQQHIEPGGALPDWMVNSMLVEIPFNTLNNLRQLVKEEKYQRAVLEYDELGIAIGFKVKHW